MLLIFNLLGDNNNIRIRRNPKKLTMVKNSIRERRMLMPVLCALLAIVISSCGTQKKLSNLQKEAASAHLSLGEKMEMLDTTARQITRDTLKIKDKDGNELLIKKTTLDEESGDMIASEVLNEVVVTARFRHVAEHRGKVDLQFQVIVPESMRDSHWQLRFYPDMYIFEDSIRLDPVMITGNAYRKQQLRGYQQYDRFLSRIVSDSTRFISVGLLEIFLERNIPQIYSFKKDSSFVSDEEFYTCYGVSERQAIEHYTNKIARSANERRKSMIDRKYRKYIKSPILSEGVKLDTVMVGAGGDFIYNYTQTINTRPRLKKVDVVLSGEIYEQDRCLYEVPRSEPLTFYISSLSAFTNETEHYMTKVISRQVEANTACHVDFAVGRSDINLNLGNNRREIGRIKGNLSDLMQNQSFDLDSIVVCAYASPEGSVDLNNRLSKSRSASISKYFNSYIKSYQDSLVKATGMIVDEFGQVSKYKPLDIPFISRSSGENWTMLDLLIIRDTTLTEGQKSAYSEYSRIKNLDQREMAMRKENSYKYISTELYPQLRTVRFDFYLHRKGMVLDTVTTTELDTMYMAGVQALKAMDYDLAIKFLQPYNDFNTAVAYLSLDRNLSALAILQTLDRTPEINYLLAILYARLDDPQQAVQCYMDACNVDRAFVYRGNLDPEISELIKTYGLNQEDEDDFEY